MESSCAAEFNPSLLMQTELTRSFVVYAGQSKLLELATEIAETKSLSKSRSKIILATKIRLWLKALSYYEYLDKPTIDKLVYTLADLSDANAIPVSPSISTIEAPAILVGIPGDDGGEGQEGPEGGGVPFSATGVDEDTIIDSFDISESRAVDYTVSVYGDDGMRIQRLMGGWLADGSVYDDDGGMGQTISGDTSPVTLSIVVSGTTAQLFAAVTSGDWTIEGTRKYIPNNGSGIAQPTSLAEGKIWIGNSSNAATAQTLSGDVTVTAAGVTAIGSEVIVNADISATAAISVSKLAAMSASLAVATDASGFLTTVAGVSATEVGYLSGVTSDIQTQLDSKLSAATGAISTVVSTDLTASRAVIANPLGKIAVSAVTTTELSILSGLTASTAELNTLDGITASTTELNYTDGVTSAIQTQLDGKLNGGLVTESGTTYTVLATNIGKIHNFTSSSARTITLPAASTVTAGFPLWLKDASYNAGTNNITVNRAGSDTFEDGSTSLVISSDGALYGVYSDGTSKWYLI
jgi:hypothetical protein